MPVSLEDFAADNGAPRTSWLRLSGPLDGAELLIRYAEPEAGQKFRSRMRSVGIMKANREGGEDVAPGRERDYIVAFVAHYVSDWRGVVTVKDGPAAPYDAERVVGWMATIGSTFYEVHQAVGQEERFFGKGVGGST